MNLSASIEIPIKCPKCGHTIKKRLSELQRKQDIACRCGVTFKVDPSGFQSAGKSLDDFQKALAKLGK